MVATPFGILLAMFVILVVMMGIVGSLAAKKRREMLQAAARQLGFSFSPDKDHDLADRYAFLEPLSSGSNRYAFNILSGTAANGEQARIFDYHYETHTTDSKGRRQTSHHYLSVFTLTIPRLFPELNIKPEGIFSKIGQAFGFDDIDFESLEFSKRYCVRSPDKKFAYDFCNARMIDYLLHQPDLVIEVDGNTLALTFSGQLATDAILPAHQALLEIRSRMPDYLFNA